MNTPPPLHLISSMATQKLLAELLAADALAHPEVAVRLESVGGVDAARRVAAGEAFDAVVLGADALQRLMAGGHVHPDSRVDLVHSGVAVAVRAGAPRPDIGTEAALKAAVLAARSVGCSTGPSGVALAALFERWGIADAVRAKQVTPPPGTPVGALIARGEVELGVQQLSELMHLLGASRCWAPCPTRSRSTPFLPAAWPPAPASPRPRAPCWRGWRRPPPPPSSRPTA